MSAHVLLNLLNELGAKEIKFEPCQAFYLFFAMTTIVGILTFVSKIIFMHS